MSLDVLFVLHLFSHTRHFHEVLAEAIGRGHRVRVAGLNKLKGNGVVARPPPHAPHLGPVAYELLPPERRDFWRGYADALRGSRNLGLYDHPALADAAVFRARAEGYADPVLKRLRAAPGTLRRRLFDRACALAEDLIPADPLVVAELERRRPDVVLTSPLIFNEMLFLNDWVKAAHALGIPVGFPVFSWDNLTTKGIAQVRPDRMFVWNAVQKEEAVALHGWPADEVDVLGAWRFDGFADAPAADRGALHRRFGLDPDRRLLVYIGSSPIVAPREGAFVRDWLAAVRSAPDPAIRDANVLVRPHPRNLAAWRETDGIAGRPGVALQPVEELTLFQTDDLRDILVHADAVVGLVTSAMIEAALLGKPVHTVLTGAAGEGQTGTVHFGYLTSVGGGLLHVADGLASHVAALAATTARRDGAPDPRARAFVRAFVDPPGPGPTASVRLVDAIERLAATPKGRARVSPAGLAGRALLRAALATRLLPVARKPPEGRFQA